MSPETVGPDEILLAAVPVFGGRVPAAALERLSALKGSGQSAVAVAVYGNRAFDDALPELKDALEANGFHVAAAGAFAVEHSIARPIATGRHDARSTSCRALRSPFNCRVSASTLLLVSSAGIRTAAPPPSGRTALPVSPIQDGRSAQGP